MQGALPCLQGCCVETTTPHDSPDCLKPRVVLQQDRSFPGGLGVQPKKGFHNHRDHHSLLEICSMLVDLFQPVLQWVASNQTAAAYLIIEGSCSTPVRKALSMLEAPCRVGHNQDHCNTPRLSRSAQKNLPTNITVGL